VKIRGEYRPVARADFAVARILAATAAEEVLYAELLAAIGDSLDWDFGAWWEISDDAASLRCIETWRSGLLQDGDFETLTRQTTLATGIGLPGRVWATERPAWIVDVTVDPNFPRGTGTLLAGLHSGFAFPPGAQWA